MNTENLITSYPDPTHDWIIPTNVTVTLEAQQRPFWAQYRIESAECSAVVKETMVQLILDSINDIRKRETDKPFFTAFTSAGITDD